MHCSITFRTMRGSCLCCTFWHIQLGYVKHAYQWESRGHYHVRWGEFLSIYSVWGTAFQLAGLFKPTKPFFSCLVQLRKALLELEHLTNLGTVVPNTLYARFWPLWQVHRSILFLSNFSVFIDSVVVRCQVFIAALYSHYLSCDNKCYVQMCVPVVSRVF